MAHAFSLAMLWLFKERAEICEWKSWDAGNRQYCPTRPFFPRSFGLTHLLSLQICSQICIQIHIIIKAVYNTKKNGTRTTCVRVRGGVARVQERTGLAPVHFTSVRLRVLKLVRTWNSSDSPTPPLLARMFTLYVSLFCVPTATYCTSTQQTDSKVNNRTSDHCWGLGKVGLGSEALKLGTETKYCSIDVLTAWWKLASDEIKKWFGVWTLNETMINVLKGWWRIS